jgi:hypothetical protein
LAQFQDLPRAVLLAISNLSGDQYRDVEGDELVAELRRQGHEPDPIAVRNLMDRLSDDGYVTFSAAFGIGPKALSLIRLADRGRQEVEGWPKPGAISAADVKALIRAFEEHSKDPDVPETERRKTDAIASAGRDLGVDVVGNVIASWLRSIGIG